MEASFEEQLGATLGEDFPYPYNYKTQRSCTNDNTIPQWDDFIDSIPIDQYMEMPAMHHSSSTESLTKSSIITSPCKKNSVQEDQQLVNKEETSRPKRKRQPSQVQGHILAERKRRELLSQMFISLSAIIPGLKKVFFFFFYFLLIFI